MKHTQAFALFLATGLAFEGCASRLARKPPLPLVNTVNGIAVHADPIFIIAPGDDVLFEGLTRVTVSLENLEKRYAGARSAEIAIDLPDGSRFPAMPPEVALRQVEMQRDRWAADPQEPPVQPQPEPPPGTTTKEMVARGVLLAACLPAALGYVLPPLWLITGPPCLVTPCDRLPDASQATEAPLGFG